MNKVLEVNDRCNISGEIGLLLSHLNNIHVAKTDLDELAECKAIAASIKSTHEDEFRRISHRFDTEICGDIIQMKPKTEDEVVALGIDAVKNVVFEEMGFNESDRERLWTEAEDK